jgi:MFS superfamily sulfate permease-like transporter/mannitol/fructose-specific phosphotransferase system IIA component (Ntr-type)
VRDALDSLVVFLVALPLCIGIAVACGVPPERGLITGIVGGIIVGVVSGAPLLVSGPAASLIVLVVEIVDEQGLAALAPIVMLAGVWQCIAGVLKLGQWFRAVAPAVIQGMLIGIGVLILVSQLHVAVDADPKSGFIENLITFPATLVGLFSGGIQQAFPLAVGGGTIVLMVAWTLFHPKKLKLVPGHLVAVVTVTTVVAVTGADVRFLDISPQFFSGLSLVTLSDLRGLWSTSAITSSLIFAFVASAATLLTAAAIDQRQTHSQADYNLEMLVQGIGNLTTGCLGGLPMTGVIVRSSVNVDAGARTRISTILHGIWILLFVAVAPQVLALIPRACLGAILVLTGYKLINIDAMKKLYEQGRSELAICLITLVGVVVVDLFSGILAGLAAAIAKLVYTFASLKVRSASDEDGVTHHIHLAGSATFLRLPYLADVLRTVPEDRELHVHIHRLDHIDHACLELLSDWNRRREQIGQPGMVVEWNELTDRYKTAVSGVRQHKPSKSLLRIVWQEWKQIYRPVRHGPVVDSWLEPDRVRVQVPAETLDDVLQGAAELLASRAGIDASTIADALRERPEGHIGLGEGVSLPHAPLPGLSEPLIALMTTSEPISVDGDDCDVFFVLHAPEDDHHDHLRALARVGRLCLRSTLLDELRAATNPEALVAAVARAERSFAEEAAPSSFASRRRSLAVIEVAARDPAHIAEILSDGFESPVAVSPGEPIFEVVQTVVRVPSSHQLLLLPIHERDVAVLQALLREQINLEPDEMVHLHILRPGGLQDVASGNSQPRELALG